MLRKKKMGKYSSEFKTEFLVFVYFPITRSVHSGTNSGHIDSYLHMKYKQKHCTYE